MAEIKALEGIPVEARKDFIDGVFSGRYGPGEIPMTIFMATGSILMEEVFKGFGRSWFDPAITVGDFDSLDLFQKNVFLFSGAKTTRQAMDLGKAILGPDGNLVPWAQYKERALKIDKAYNLNWLGTERRTAFALAQSARQWNDIDQVKDIFTHLRYLTKEDLHVRKDHQILNNIIRPVDDPFWDTHFPPVDWNCRCTFEQLMEDEVPRRIGRVDSKVKEVPSPLFRINPGKTGKIFGPEHPYFKDVLDKYPYLQGLPPRPPIPRPTSNPSTKPPAPQGPANPYIKQVSAEYSPEEMARINPKVLEIMKLRRPSNFKNLEGKATRIVFFDGYNKSGSKGSFYSPMMDAVVVRKYASGTKAGGKRASRWVASEYYRTNVLTHEMGHRFDDVAGVTGMTHIKDPVLSAKFDEIFNKAREDMDFIQVKRLTPRKLPDGRPRTVGSRTLYDEEVTEFNSSVWDNQVGPRFSALEDIRRRSRWSRGRVSIDQATDNLFAKDKEDLLRMFNLSTEAELKAFEKSIRDTIKKARAKGVKNAHDFSEMMGGVADTIEALTAGRRGWGHGAKYFATESARKAEVFAHFFENAMDGNPLFNYIWPELYEGSVELVEEAIKAKLP